MQLGIRANWIYTLFHRHTKTIWLMQNSTRPKKVALSLILILSAFSTFSQVVNIPDANFKAALLANPSINTNGDNEIQLDEAHYFYGDINVPGKNIADLTGVAEFWNAFSVDCSNNQLTTLDVSHNIGADGSFAVNCQNNQLTSLLVSPYIYAIRCGNNRLTSLDLSKANQYYLVEVHCEYNQLTDLRLPASYSGYFTRLQCDHNQLTSLDVSKLYGLSELQVQNNQLTTLNVSANPYLSNVNCSFNALTSLNMKNGNNAKISGSSFNATSNPNLRCIDVSDLLYARANWANDIDEGAKFSGDCSGTLVVNIPDTNFKTILLRNSTINTNGDGEIQVAEAEIVETLNVPNQSIASLTGIEQFVSLTSLNCSKNLLTTLDLKTNKELVQLRCAENQLTSLNVSGLTKLNMLRSDDNRLTALNVTTNTGLTSLHCSNNQVTSLNVNSNHLLLELDCSTNKLTYLGLRNGNNVNFTMFKAQGNPNIACMEVDDVAFAQANWTASVDAGIFFSNTCYVNIPDPRFKSALVANASINTNRDSEIHFTEAQAFTGLISVPNRSISDLTGIEAFLQLTRLRCQINKISNLDLSRNTKLVELNCSDNQLTRLDVNHNNSLTTFDLSGNKISSIDVSQLNNLVQLWCSRNQLTELNLSNNTKLIGLGCTTNQLTQLDLSTNTSLVTLLFDENEISSIDLKPLPNLTMLACGSNHIANLDLSANLRLQVLYCYNNLLTSLDLSLNTALTELVCAQNQIASLDLRACSKLSRIECQNNQMSNLQTGSMLDEVWCADNKLTHLSINSYYLFCENNQLTSLKGTIIRGAVHCFNNLLDSLDLSASKQMQFVFCKNNRLTYLNLKNGNNTKMWVPDATQNPTLTCVEVDDPNFADANWRSGFDPGVTFSVKCGQSSTASANSTEAISISPNPATSTLTIGGSQDIESVTAFNEASGEVMPIPFDASKREADISHLRNAVYLIKVASSQSTGTFRIVKK